MQKSSGTSFFEIAPGRLDTQGAPYSISFYEPGIELMCGIAGIFNYQEVGKAVDQELLERMTDILKHRGPDGYGYHVNHSLGIGLGHRRLAIVTPLFDRTFFRDVKQLRPGEFMRISQGGIRKQIYWQISESELPAGSPDGIITELREQLADVVASQLMADVQVGAFFSGGIDSSAVAAFAMKSGIRPPCFGVHFSNQDVIDERPFQEAAAKSFGLELNLVTMDGSTFSDDMIKLMYYQDQPVIGPAMLPMYYVNQLASKQVKVCLGGQGADEIFGGYARYGFGDPMTILRSWWHSKKTNTGPSKTAKLVEIYGSK